MLFVICNVFYGWSTLMHSYYHHSALSYIIILILLCDIVVLCCVPQNSIAAQRRIISSVCLAMSNGLRSTNRMEFMLFFLSSRYSFVHVYEQWKTWTNTKNLRVAEEKLVIFALEIPFDNKILVLIQKQSLEVYLRFCRVASSKVNAILSCRIEAYFAVCAGNFFLSLEFLSIFVHRINSMILDSHACGSSPFQTEHWNVDGLHVRRQ